MATAKNYRRGIGIAQSLVKGRGQETGATNAEPGCAEVQYAKEQLKEITEAILGRPPPDTDGTYTTRPGPHGSNPERVGKGGIAALWEVNIGTEEGQQHQAQQ